jgi:hypothetical protein
VNKANLSDCPTARSFALGKVTDNRSQERP